MSISPPTLECPSVPRLWNVHQSPDSGISVSPATLERLSVPRLWNVCQSRNSRMSVIRQFRNSGMSVHSTTPDISQTCDFWMSVATLECLSVWNVLNVKAGRIDVPLVVLVPLYCNIPRSVFDLLSLSSTACFASNRFTFSSTVAVYSKSSRRL